MKLFKISLFLLLTIVVIQCKNKEEVKSNGKEVWEGKVEGFPMFFKEGEDIIGIPCSDTELIATGDNGQIDSLSLEFTLTLVRIKKLNRVIDYFSDIEFPEHQDGFHTEVRFKVQANEVLCKQLSEDYANSKNKSPMDILLYREIPNVPYYREIMNYEITEWRVYSIAY